MAKEHKPAVRSLYHDKDHLLVSAVESEGLEGGYNPRLRKVCNPLPMHQNHRHACRFFSTRMSKHFLCIR
jgi:hypothetical protein